MFHETHSHSNSDLHLCLLLYRTVSFVSDLYNWSSYRREEHTFTKRYRELGETSCDRLLSSTPKSTGVRVRSAPAAMTDNTA